MMVESIGLLLIFHRSGFHNPRLENYDSNEHSLRNYHITEKYFSMEIFSILSTQTVVRHMQHMKVI